MEVDRWVASGVPCSVKEFSVESQACIVAISARKRCSPRPSDVRLDRSEPLLRKRSRMSKNKLVGISLFDVMALYLSLLVAAATENAQRGR